MLRAAWRRWPRHRQLKYGGTEAPRQPGQAQPRREGSAQRREGGGRTGSWVGGARAVQACCETGEVTKRPPGPEESERAVTSPPTPGHAGPRRTAWLPFVFAWDSVGWVPRETRDPAGLASSCSNPPGWLDSQLLLPSGFPSEPLSSTHGTSFQCLVGSSSSCRVQAEGFSDVCQVAGHRCDTCLGDRYLETQIA